MRAPTTSNPMNQSCVVASSHVSAVGTIDMTTMDQPSLYALFARAGHFERLDRLAVHSMVQQKTRTSRAEIHRVELSSIIEEALRLDISE
jgi:hypothetical protein